MMTTQQEINLTLRDHQPLPVGPQPVAGHLGLLEGQFLGDWEAKVAAAVATVDATVVVVDAGVFTRHTRVLATVGKEARGTRIGRRASAGGGGGADDDGSGCPFNGFGGGGSASWKDPWGDDIPWQGQQQEGTPPGSVGMTAYGGAYAPVPPKPDAGALADSTAYCTAYIPQPPSPSIQRQQQQQQRQQQQDFGSASEHATVGGAAGQPESPDTRSSSTSAAAGPGGRAPSSALAGGAAKSAAPPEESLSTPSATLPDDCVSSACLAEGAAGQHATPRGAFGASAGGGKPSGAQGVSSDIGDDEIQDCGGPSVWSVAMAQGLKDMMFSG
eukprot:g16279.t1